MDQRPRASGMAVADRIARTAQNSIRGSFMKRAMFRCGSTGILAVALVLGHSSIARAQFVIGNGGGVGGGQFGGEFGGGGGFGGQFGGQFGGGGFGGNFGGGFGGGNFG